MEIVEIYKDFLYSISFDENDLDEYRRIFREWHNLDFLITFFTEHKDYINSDFWLKAGLNPDEPEKSAFKVIEEADKLEVYIRQLVKNSTENITPDFDEYFRFLGGKYACLWSLEPVKSYGTLHPSLLRLYAIKMDKNCYLIVYGGIKLGKSIQNSPVLKENVFNKIDTVLTFLQQNGIMDVNDIDRKL